MIMRSYLCVPLLFLALIAASPAAAALGRSDQILITDPLQAQRLMTAVENALWVADGDDAANPVYVIYSTQCGFSQQLFERTRNPGLKVQLRWIAAAAPTRW